jgi:hypothetical protein
MSFTASASGANSEPAPAVVADGAPEAASATLDARAPIASVDASASGTSLDDLAVFVGANAARFLRPLTTGEARSRRGICWPGLLLPTPWLLYRKMYGLAALTVLSPVLLALLHMANGPLRWLSLGFMILGAFGKRLYLAKARRTIAAIRAAAPDEASARAAIAQAGGVSIAGAIFGLLLIGAFFAFAAVRT